MSSLLPHPEYSGKGLALGTLQVYRSWRLFDDKVLYSVSFPTTWRSGENIARCNFTQFLCSCFACARAATPEKTPETMYSHSAPHEVCHCGFYGTYEPGYYIDQLENWARLAGATIQYPKMLFATGIQFGAIGVVELYGRVILGTKGARAEKARIVALAGFDVDGYDDIPRFPSKEELLAAYPPQSVDSLIGSQRGDEQS